MPTLHIRLSSEEYETLGREAVRERLNLSAHVRRRLFLGPVPGREVRPAAPLDPQAPDPVAARRQAQARRDELLRKTHP